MASASAPGSINKAEELMVEELEDNGPTRQSLKGTSSMKAPSVGTGGPTTVSLVHTTARVIEPHGSTARSSLSADTEQQPPSPSERPSRQTNSPSEGSTSNPVRKSTVRVMPATQAELHVRCGGKGVACGGSGACKPKSGGSDSSSYHSIEESDMENGEGDANSLTVLLRWRTDCWKKTRPRTRQWIYCLITTVLIIVALAAQVVSFRRAMHQTLLRQVEEQIRLMGVTYRQKLDDMAQLSQTWAHKSDLIDFIKGVDSDRNVTWDSLRSHLKYDMDYMAVEYATVFDTSGRILVDMGFNRTGVFHDPKGAVSRVNAHPHRGKLQVADLVSWEELERMQVPIFRESFTHLLDNDITHPFDTSGHGCMRYVVQPIFEYPNGTGTSIGALLLGDLTNGKTPIPYLVTDAFHEGFSGLYTKTGDGKSWVRSSSSVFLPKTVPQADHVVISTLDPITPELREELVQVAASKPGEVVKMFKDDFAWVATTAPRGMWNQTELPNEVPPAVMVRGLYLPNDTTFWDLLRDTWYYAAIMILVNVLSVYFASSAFIAPLERLAVRLKDKKTTAATMRMDELGSLDLFAKFLLSLVITVAAAIVCSLMIALRVETGVNVLVQSLTLSELGVARVAYSEQIIQMSHLCRSLANDPSIRRLAARPHDATQQNETSDILAIEMASRQLEYLVLVDTKQRLIGVNDRRNLYLQFDPDTLATQTVEEHLYHKYTAQLPYEDFHKLHPTILQRHIFENAPDSKLSPYNTKLDPFARWASVPVYGTYNLDKNKPDAAIIAGDVINGKSAVAESILKVTGEGYVAFYGLYDENDLNSGLKLLNSFLIERGTKKMFVDEPIPLDVVKKAVKYTEDSVPTPVLGAAKIRGKTYVLAAERVTMNRMIENGDEIDDLNFPRVYVVYGKDRSATHELEMVSYRWLLGTSILQVLMMLLLNYTAYTPFGKLMRVLQAKGFVNKKDRPTVWKVLVAYLFNPCFKFWKNVFTRSPVVNFKEYVLEPLRRLHGRVCRRSRRRSRYAPSTGPSRNSSTASTRGSITSSAGVGARYVSGAHSARTAPMA